MLPKYLFQFALVYLENISYKVDLISIGVLNSHSGLIYSDVHVYCQQIKIVYLTYVIYLSKTFANEKRIEKPPWCSG